MSLAPVKAQLNLSALAKILSNAGLQRMMFADDFKKHARQLKRILLKNGVETEEKSTISELIDISYEHLLRHYRYEYLYKVALLNSYVLKNHCLSDTILLNEFRIGNSKADTILVNGTNKVFEIKTELDSRERLCTQINDYYKGFSEVYIVIHHSEISKYLAFIPEQVGIMTFSKHNTIEPCREATIYTDQLDVVMIMKALRKDEYLELIHKIAGEIPKATAVQLFKTCVNILSNYPVLQVQGEFLKIIKKRINASTNELINNPELPAALRLSCYYYNPDQNDYLALINRLAYQI
jgi:hypothetical protein